MATVKLMTSTLLLGILDSVATLYQGYPNMKHKFWDITSP